MTILPTKFDRLEKSFLMIEVQFKMFWLPVKTSCPPSENVIETPANRLSLSPLFKLDLRNTKHVLRVSIKLLYRHTSGSLGEREMLWEHEP